MAADQASKSPGFRRITPGGIAAEHPVREGYAVYAGPSTAEEFNTIRADLTPRACWRLEDVRFEFDSSFITPAAADEFRHLSTLMKEHPGAPVSIFGHADPVGDDEYNKKLSGRRAIAVYGMLARNTDMWEELYSNPLGRDDWKVRAVQIILLDLGFSPGAVDGKKGPETTEAIRKYQTDNGMAPSGEADRGTRAKLFLAYMDKHCRDEEGNAFKLEKKDFLARGADSGGKGDYQGCGEFNPLLMFSAAENEEYKKEENREKRNADNAPNRRVLVYLFRPGRRVDPGTWPCARAREGTAEC
ncbi:MAG TPA: peptidoglycan-binding protein, partial [Thermodesulfobacteriota bacterium]|nr:peptidoglycan-binding protein [Thermodesulfobacteriota bacterium]